MYVCLMCNSTYSLNIHEQCACVFNMAYSFSAYGQCVYAYVSANVCISEVQCEWGVSEFLMCSCSFLAECLGICQVMAYFLAN